MMLEQVSNIVYGRAPELNEIEEMFNPQTSLFEDTKENHVALFSFIFDPLEFTIQKLRELENQPNNIPAELLQPLLETYLKRPRTIEEYCNEVWNQHTDAQELVKRRRDQRE